MEVKNESKSIRKTDLRKVQSHQEERFYQNHLREPQAQTETGLILLYYKEETDYLVGIKTADSGLLLRSA